jgi:hypothetical protein
MLKKLGVSNLPSSPQGLQHRIRNASMKKSWIEENMIKSQARDKTKNR